MHIYFILLAVGIIISTNNPLFSRAECDSIRYCVDDALTLEVTSGKGAHYVDIDKNPIQNLITQEFTFQAWMKPQRQAGHRLYIAGLWGPARDVNDVWVLYITSDDKLVFEINGENTNLDQLDNTVVSVDAAGMYDKWTHVTAMFEGSTETAYLYIDGVLDASSRNAQYPARQLRRLQNPELKIQIGSSNAVSNDNSFRTFKGQLDEISIWNTVLDPETIMCRRHKVLAGSENGLIVYYRCNKSNRNPDESVFDLCDASENNNFGRMRSGASLQPSDRVEEKNTFYSPMEIVDTLYCIQKKTYTFTIEDSSECSQGIRLLRWHRYDDRTIENYFKVLPSENTTLQPNVPQTFQLEIDADFIGTLNEMYLYVLNHNTCGYNNGRIPLKITRLTQLGYSTGGMDMGLLKAHCIEKPYADTIITICNNTDKAGTPRTVTVSQISTGMPDVFQPLLPAMPFSLSPGECRDITIRFISGDTSAVYWDNVEITSDDECSPVRQIPITGEVVEVIGITLSDGTTRVDTVDFGTVCRNFASDPFNYLWADWHDENIVIDTILVPPHFQSQSFKFPVVLQPETGYRANYFRFTPTAQVNALDSIIFVVRSGDCTIRKPVYVKGRGYVAEVEFISDLVDFGDVIVGQELVRNIDVRNTGTDTILVSFIVKRGDGFYFPGTRQFGINPGQTRSVPVSFRPTFDSVYNDNLCMLERRCFEQVCIPIRGRGVFERFEYEPVIMRTENVVACGEKLDTLTIYNISGSAQTLSNFLLDDPSGKYSLVDPPNFPANMNIPSGQSDSFIFNYAPNDVTRDRADRAYLRYETLDGRNGLPR